MIKNSTDINKRNNHLSPQLIENVFKTFPVCVCWCVWGKKGGVLCLTISTLFQLYHGGTLFMTCIMLLTLKLTTNISNCKNNVI